MPNIPSFQTNGLLPSGDYEVSFADLRQSILVAGATPPTSTTWDAKWQAHLVDNFETLTTQLWKVGITEIFADGSFAEDKDHPNDIDGYFECDLKFLASGQLERQLNFLDAHKIWTWDPASRRPYLGYDKKQLPMWHQYRVELYPHVPNIGTTSGIVDKYGNQLEFPSAFRQSRRDGAPRGIIKIGQGGSA